MGVRSGGESSAREGSCHGSVNEKRRSEIAGTLRSVKRHRTQVSENHLLPPIDHKTLCRVAFGDSTNTSAAHGRVHDPKAVEHTNVGNAVLIREAAVIRGTWFDEYQGTMLVV